MLIQFKILRSKRNKDPSNKQLRSIFIAATLFMHNAENWEQ